MVLFFCIAVLFCKGQSQHLNDSLLQKLHLSAAQKNEMKALIADYKSEDRQRRNELRRKMFRQLTVEQQAVLRKHWRYIFSQYRKSK